MKLEELPKSTSEVRKFSDGNTLLTLWFDGPKCRSMEVVFDIQANETVLFCSNKKQHFYNTRKEVRYGYELSEVAVNFQNPPLGKITLLKRSISHLNERLRMAIFNLLRPIEGRVEVL
ncbi:hypothetical protein OAP38_01865 [Opitutales bacterium]|nr:hypothetical protein [Opitutales bacterium]MDA8806175.1 hypothetical protein [Opitutales bacterium]MDC0646478.1 hypothetical protein [Opitutales bacterium]